MAGNHGEGAWSRPTGVRWVRLCTSSALVALTFVAQAVSAQALPTRAVEGGHAALGLDEIIVTAERKLSSAQVTPIAITAFTPAALEKSQIVTVEDVSRGIPNVGFSRIAGNAKIFIRGIGLDTIAQGSDARVAIYTDGVYNGRTQAAFSSFFDVARVEVLRGPQGTLYGRNATAGALNIISKDPTNYLEGYGSLTVGNYSQTRAEAAIGGPLSDAISARLAFQSVDRSGFGKNINSDEDIDDERRRAVRGKLKISPSSDISIMLAGDYSRQKDHSAGYRLVGLSPNNTLPGLRFGGTLPTKRRDTAGFGPNLFLENYGFSADATLKTGGFEFTSITAYRNLDTLNKTNLSMTTADVSRSFFAEKANQFSQEFRVSRDFGAVEAIIGAYFFHERADADNQSAFAGALFGLPTQQVLQGFRLGGRQKTNAYALFGQATVHISDRLGLDMGARYSDEHKTLAEYFQRDFTRPFSQTNPFLSGPPAALGFLNRASRKASWSSFDPKVVLHYKLADGVFSYASYSSGFKSGGFNVGGLQTPFDPEEIEAYEAGIKADLLDRRLRTNFASFYYNYKNLQVNQVENLVLVTRNAAKARIYGVEAEITALPTMDLRLSLNAGWLHTEYVNYKDVLQAAGPALRDLAGNQFQYAPKFKLEGEAGYTFPIGIGELTPRIDVIWVDKVFFTAFNVPWAAQKARTEVNLFLDLDAGNGWSANAFVRNATNDYYVVSGTVAGPLSGYAVFGQYGAPRTFGISVKKSF